MDVLDTFRAYVAQPDSDAAFCYVLAHPVLLWPERWPEIQSWIATRAATDQASLNGLLVALQDLGGKLAEQPAGFPEGAGPIERLAAKYEAGEIGLEHALIEAAGPESAGALAPFYVRLCASRARALGDDWRAAVVRFRILLAALDGLLITYAADPTRLVAGP